MNTSVVITVLNEEKSISRLIESLLKQTKKPSEIVIVDGGSSDKTVELIRHFQKKNKVIRLIQEGCTRAEGRNLGVDMAKNEIIAMTDAGCVADKNWLKRISDPFKNEGVDMVAGFYKIQIHSRFQKALAYFIGVTPRRFSINFLPSARSVAFRRGLWDRVGGFPEKMKDAGEDTVFNYLVLKEGASISRMKSAYVEWTIPNNFKDAIKKIFLYAKADAKSKILWNPSKGIASHNIKVLFVFIRYIIVFILFMYSFQYTSLIFILLLSLLLYILYSFRKVYIDTRDIKSGLWAVAIQFMSDFAVMFGFLAGFIGK
jgi:glycosyltransferase involved in cell wall biosynthesis